MATSHAFRCDVLIAAIPLMILVGHSVLYAMGKMASNGELRYMLIVAPFWALLATRGMAVLTPSPGTPEEGRGEGSSGEPETDDLPVASFAYPEPRRRWFLNPYLLAGLAAIAPVFANFGYKVLPLVQTEDWKTAARIAEWYKTSGVATDYPYIMAAHPGVTYALDIAPLDPMVRDWNAKNLVENPNGTILVWDDVYGNYNADAAKSLSALNFDLWMHWLVDRTGPSLVDRTTQATVMGVMRSQRDIKGEVTPYEVYVHRLEFDPNGRRTPWEN